MSSSSLSSSLSLLPPPAGAAASRGGESSLLGAPNGPLAGPFVRSVSQLSPMPQLAPDAPASVVVEAYRRKMEAQPDNPVAVCAIQALTEVVERSKATTLMELQIELKAASEELRAIDRTSIPLGAGCELFNRYVTRISPEQMGFPECRRRLIERGTLFADNSMASRRKISEHGDRFIRHGCSILVHGLSRVVTAVLRHAVKKGKYFSVVVTEGRPFGSGIEVAKELLAEGIPTTFILDSAVAYAMEKIDFVLLGAEGVVESGGIINQIGSYQISMIARALNVPVYVAAESYKFARHFPLTQRDLPEAKEDQKPLRPCERDAPFPDKLVVHNPRCDYTPPQYLTLLFTDIGILTPSAVSDELIKLYY